MGIAELVAEAERQLLKTTVSYPEWRRRLNAGRYTPKDGSTTAWGRALAALREARLLAEEPAPAPAPDWVGDFYGAFKEVQAYDARNQPAGTPSARVRKATIGGREASRHEIVQGEVWGGVHRSDIYASPDAIPITEGRAWRLEIPVWLPDTNAERFTWHTPQMHNYLWDLHSTIQTPDNPHAIFVDSWTNPVRLIYRATGQGAPHQEFTLLNLTDASGNRLPAPYNRWITVALSIRFSDRDGHVRVERDGELVGEQSRPTLFTGDRPYWKQALYCNQNFNGGRSVVYHGVGTARRLA